MKTRVYHGSAVRGLPWIDPRRSTHETAYVYAMRAIGHCVAFLGGIDDLHVAKEIVDYRLAVVERYVGAFARYGGVTGSVYELPGDTFFVGRTAWEGDVVSSVSVPVLVEHEIADAWHALRSAAEGGEVLLYPYPERPSAIPNDDQDLVEKAVIFARWEGNESSVRLRMRAQHPSLVDRFEWSLDHDDLQSLCRKYGIPALKRRTSGSTGNAPLDTTDANNVNRRYALPQGGALLFETSVDQHGFRYAEQSPRGRSGVISRFRTGYCWRFMRKCGHVARQSRSRSAATSTATTSEPTTEQWRGTSNGHYRHTGRCQEACRHVELR